MDLYYIYNQKNSCFDFDPYVSNSFKAKIITHSCNYDGKEIKQC